MWRKTLKEMKKTGSKTSLKSYPKLVKRTPFYRVQKTSRWDQFLAKMAIGRPANGHFSDR